MNDNDQFTHRAAERYRRETEFENGTTTASFYRLGEEERARRVAVERRLS